MTDIQRISLDEVVLHFAELEDPRSTINRRHPLVSVVVIAILAVLAGANGPTAIAEWAARKEEFLIAAPDLPHGVPRKDVFRRVLMALRPEAFRACFINWLKSLRATAAGAGPPILEVVGLEAGTHPPCSSQRRSSSDCYSPPGLPKAQRQEDPAV